MTQPTVYVDVDVVKAALGLTPYDTVDDAWLALSVHAVNCAVAYWRPDLDYSRCNPSGRKVRVGAFDPSQFVQTQYVTASGQAQTVWLYKGDPMLTWGAVQLACRWYRRRGGEDVAAYAEMGGPPPGIDTDIALALGINRYYRPVVA